MTIYLIILVTLMTVTFYLIKNSKYMSWYHGIV